MHSEKELLQLAGKLAMSCHMILNSNCFTVSEAIKLMEKALREYDDVIFSNLE